jgi:UDP-N-acetyl-D-mannosaminuronic acid transferase (WecB/TagA/CpsF family)
MPPRRSDAVSVSVDCLTQESAITAAEKLLCDPCPHNIFAVNLEKSLRACNDPILTAQLRNTNLLSHPCRRIRDRLGLTGFVQIFAFKI